MPQPTSIAEREILELGRIAAGECERADGETAIAASLRQLSALCHSASVILVPITGIEIYAEMEAVSAHAWPAPVRTPDLALLSRNPLSQLAQSQLTSTRWLCFSRGDVSSERTTRHSFETWAEAMSFDRDCDTLSSAWNEARPDDGAGFTLFADHFVARDRAKCNVLGQMLAINPTSPVRQDLQRDLDRHSKRCPTNCPFFLLNQRRKLIAAGLRAGISDVDLANLFAKKGCEKVKLTPASIKKYRTRIRRRIFDSKNVLLPIADPLDAPCPTGHYCRDRADTEFAALWNRFSGEEVHRYGNSHDRDPFAEGHSAAKNGKTANANPYPQIAEQHQLWDEGFYEGLPAS